MSSLSNSYEEKFDIKDKYRRLKKRTVRKLISLPPKYLGNLNKGIEDAIFKLNQETFKEFDGVPVQMDKKMLLQNLGSSIDDHPYIQFYVDINCIVFSPKVGKKVKATVAKVGETYLGCLICDRINATVFKREKKSKNSENDHSAPLNGPLLQQQLDSLYIGQEIIIQIKSITYEKNDLFIVATFFSTIPN